MHDKMARKRRRLSLLASAVPMACFFCFFLLMLTLYHFGDRTKNLPHGEAFVSDDRLFIDHFAFDGVVVRLILGLCPVGLGGRFAGVLIHLGANWHDGVI